MDESMETGLPVQAQLNASLQGPEPLWTALHAGFLATPLLYPKQPCSWLLTPSFWPVADPVCPQK